MDAYVPLMFHLKNIYKEKLIHDVIFLDELAYNNVSMSLFHIKILQNNGNIKKFYPKNSNSKMICFLFRIILLSFLLISKKIKYGKLLVLAPWSPTSMSEKIISMIVKLFTNFIYFPGQQLPLLDAYAERFEPKRWNIFIELGYKKEKQEVSENYEPKIAICYTEEESNYKRIHGWHKTTFIPIGIPRLYGEWSDVSKEIGDNILSEELINLGFSGDSSRVICVLLTNPDYFWFSHKKGFKGMLDDAVNTLIKEFYEVPILLKIKPAMVSMFQDVDKRYSKWVKTTTCGLAAIANRSILAVSIQESSGLMEFSTASIPSIEFGMYNNLWKKITPKQSCLVDIPGIVRTSSLLEFQTEVSKINKGQGHSILIEEMRKSLNHRENIESLINLRS